MLWKSVGWEKVAQGVASQPTATDHIQMEPMKLTEDLRVHHDFPGVHWQVGIVEAPVERFVCLGLVRWVVVWREVRMRERFGCADTSARVKHEHLLQQIQS